MSNLGGFDPAWPPPVGGPAPGQAEPDQGKDVPLWVLALAGVLALGLAVVAGVMILKPPGRHAGATGPLPTAAPSYPAAWNPRIKPIADQAAVLRGLDYTHPVPVRFLSPAKFTKALTAEDGQQSKKDAADLRHATGLFRSLGLVSGDFDLARAVKGFEGGAVLAYYSFDDQRITVRGRTITPAIKATLIHELTHVLQDQNFHVGDRLRRLEKRSGSQDSAGSVLDAIVEGDAERVRHLYEDSLPAKQRQSLTAAQDRQGAAAQRRIAGVPPLVVTLLSSPYVLGEVLVQAVAAHGGNDAVDALFHQPPVHDSALYDPYRVVAHQAGATKLAVPSLRPGEKKFDSGEFGELTWYLMLAEHVPLPQALAAADGWGGDAYIGFDRGPTTCTRLAFAGRSPADAARMDAALQQWAVATPGEQSISAHGRLVDVESCDPGSGVTGSADTSSDALTLLADRGALAVVIGKGGVPAAAARCVAGKIVDTYSVAQLNSPGFGMSDPSFRANIQQFALACR